MKRVSAVLLPFVAVASLLVGCASVDQANQPAGKPAPPRAPDVFTAVTVQPLGSVHELMHGTDGKYHLVYELELTNTKRAPATVQRVDVLDAGSSRRVIASFAGTDLLNRLRTLEPAQADSATIAPNASRLLYIELQFNSLAAAPRAIAHRLHLLAAPTPGTDQPAPVTYTVARMAVSHQPTPVLGPPLAGKGWAATNGCCNSEIVHRGSVQSVNGSLFNAQRFAIDWMRLNEAGELVHGDPTVVTNYPDYGAPVLAVADGTVVETLSDLPDQTPGSLPDPRQFKSIAEVDGNHIILSIGHGRYVFYAHLQTNSLTVHVGQHVKRGQVLAKLGNSGNTSAPHLHIQLMDRPSSLGSDGQPYTIDRFGLAGQIDIAAFTAAPDVTGVWLPGPFDHATTQKKRFPLNLNVVNFPTR